MVDEIGITAGEIWAALNQSGNLTLAQLKKKIETSPNQLQQGIGWLAREGKLTMTKHGNSFMLSLQ